MIARDTTLLQRDYTPDVYAAAEHLGTYSWVITDGFDPGDQWGSVIGSMFMLNDVLADVGGETNATFRQSPMGADDEAPGYLELIEAVEAGGLTVEAVEACERALGVIDEALRAEGRNY